MSDFMGQLRGKMLDGVGLEYGAMKLFFNDGTMLTVASECHESNGNPKADVIATLGEYEREPTQQEFAIDVFLKTHEGAEEIKLRHEDRVFDDGQGNRWRFEANGQITKVIGIARNQVVLEARGPINPPDDGYAFAEEAILNYFRERDGDVDEVDSAILEIAAKRTVNEWDAA